MEHYWTFRWQLGDNLSPWAFGEVPEPSLVASMSGHWERYRTSTICMTVRWTFAMTLCSYFFPFGHGLLVPWCLWNLPRLPGLPRTKQKQNWTDRKTAKAAICWHAENIHINSNNHKYPYDLRHGWSVSMCKDTNGRTGNALCPRVRSPLKVHCKSVAKPFFFWRRTLRSTALGLSATSTVLLSTIRSTQASLAQ